MFAIDLALQLPFALVNGHESRECDRRRNVSFGGQDGLLKSSLEDRDHAIVVAAVIAINPVLPFVGQFIHHLPAKSQSS